MGDDVHVDVGVNGGEVRLEAEAEMAKDEAPQIVGVSG